MVKEMMKRVLEMEGIVLGEYVIGIGKKGSFRDELGVEMIGLMRVLKRVVDLDWIMNLGKVFDQCCF